MLLSAVGETSRRIHIGAEIALATLSDPKLSTILRTKWRVKSIKTPLGTGQNKVPDFQELLTGLRMVVWVRKGGEEAASPSLVEKIQRLLDHPAECRRFGALSLGESTHLVNDFRRWRREEDGADGILLVQDEAGELSLPIWADHISSASTRWGRFSFEERPLGGDLPESAWVKIAPIASR